jgi:hypothetical protein
VEKLYAVIFDVTLDSAGKVKSLQVARVIDPGTHSTEPVQIPVPAEYVSAAKTYLLTRTYPQNPSRFNTWLFLILRDPQGPISIHRVDVLDV